MDYQQVKPGDGLKITAEQWNLLLRMMADYSGSSTYRPPVRNQQLPFATDVIMVQNNTSDNVERYRIMQLSTAIVTPTANVDEFQRRVQMNAVKPTSSTAPFGVLLDSLTPGQMGRMAVSGYVQCWINLVGAGDTSVGPTAGSFIPDSGTGTAQIVYVDGGVGSATSTGEQWATIALGTSGGAGPVFVHLSQDGGSDGNASGSTPTYASWTYTAHDVTSGNIIARKLPLVTRRLLATSTVTANWGFIYPAASSSYYLGAAGLPPLASGESSSSDEPDSPWRLVWCDEAYGQEEDCVIGTGSESGD